MNSGSEWDYMQSLLLPWGDGDNELEKEELAYKQHGCVKTIGTVFILPPSNQELIDAFSSKHKERNLTVGARALCKHYERVSGKHPFWKLPIGSEQEKSTTARLHLDDMLQNAVWKNVHQLNPTTVVYEIRNVQGYGMRWTLTKTTTTFRGYLEPQTTLKFL